MAPAPVLMPRTHSPYGLASSRAVASSSATTTSADTITYGSASVVGGLERLAVGLDRLQHAWTG